MKSALALTFHKISREPAHSPLSDPAVDRYAITAGFFEQAVNAIPPEKCCTVSEYIEKGKGDWLILTFDDGFISDFEAVFPILKSRGMKATFFITTGNLGLSGYLSVLQLKEMVKGGMEIGSHGLTHRYLIAMERNEAMREIRESKERLEQAIGIKMVSFAPVGGHYRKWMEEFAYEVGYRAFVTMIPGRTNGGGDITRLKRNHIQSHHDVDYLSRLLNGHRGTLTINRARYHVLQIPKAILGIHNYDLVKRYLLSMYLRVSKKS